MSAAAFVKRYFRLPPAEIAWLRFVLESYDGLAFVRTLEGREGLVEVAFPPSRRGDAEALLVSLGRENPVMSETGAPDAARYEPL